MSTENMKNSCSPSREAAGIHSSVQFVTVSMRKRISHICSFQHTRSANSHCTMVENNHLRKCRPRGPSCTMRFRTYSSRATSLRRHDYIKVLDSTSSTSCGHPRDDHLRYRRAPLSSLKRTPENARTPLSSTKSQK